jgi:hypothetical protein
VCIEIVPANSILMETSSEGNAVRCVRRWQINNRITRTIGGTQRENVKSMQLGHNAVHLCVSFAKTAIKILFSYKRGIF